MFFTQIYQMMNQAVDITLVIRKKEGQLIVSAMPKSNGLKDEAQNHIVPLTLNGTPQEMDMGFMQAICQPMQKTTGLLTNMSRFEEQANKAAANSKAAKEQKDKVAKEAKEKKDKFDKLMKKAVDLEAEQKFNDALSTFKQAKGFATAEEGKKVDEKINTLRMKMSQGSLFAVGEAPQPQQIQQTPQMHVARPTGKPETTTGEQLGYGNGQNGEQFYEGHQPTPSREHNNRPYNPQPVAEFITETEPEPTMVADYSVHREDEYDQYPDFPEYSINMFNHQNV